MHLIILEIYGNKRSFTALSGPWGHIPRVLIDVCWLHRPDTPRITHTYLVFIPGRLSLPPLLVYEEISGFKIGKNGIISNYENHKEISFYVI
jgi:hypothetical protein